MILMHQNKEIAVLETNSNNKPIGYAAILDKTDIPIGTIGKNKQQEYILFDKWYQSRCLPNGRLKSDEFLNKLGYTNDETFLLSLGLSLTDTYWIKTDSNSLKWENINYHDNGFESVLGKYILYHNIDFQKSPDFTTDGIMEKFWYSVNGVPYLAKFDNQYQKLLVANEIIYSKICDLYNINHVSYIDGKCSYGQYCSCPCFIENSNSDFITALQIKHQNFQYSGINLLYHLNKDLGFTKELRTMISLDCLLHNTDRHEKNFGIIKNLMTNQLTFAPLYDNGFCLGADKKDDIKIITDSDMKIYNGKRRDFINIFGPINLDFQSDFIKEIIKEEYEKFKIPEIRFQIAISELEYGLNLFCKENNYFIQNTNSNQIDYDVADLF